MAGVEDIPQTREVSPEELERFRHLLAEAIEIADGEGVDYVVGGSIAANEWGRPTSIGDVDLIVDPPEAKRLLKAFDSHGYDTEMPQPKWLYKAVKHGKTVDLIFELEGPWYLDHKMVERAKRTEVHGVRCPVMSPEDFVVSQALAFGEDTPNYWYNALSVLTRSEIDWDYLVERSSRSPRRVLSFLLFADSIDVPVGDGVLDEIWRNVYGDR